MQFKTVVSTALLAGAVFADDGPTNTFNQSSLNELLTQGGPHYIDPTTRADWCTGQRSACSTLCGSTANNDCNSTVLTWNCSCASNHSAPGLQWYTTTLPNFLCNTLNGDCMADNANDLTAQRNCNTTFVCENLNITEFADSGAASSSGAASTTAAPTASKTGASPSSTSSTGAAVALAIGENYGIGVLGAGVAALMALML